MLIADTLRFTKDLQRSFTPEQAEDLAQALANAANDQVATTAQVAALDGKIDALGVRLTARIDAVDVGLGSRIDILDAKVDALDARLTARIDILDGKVDALEAKIGGDMAAMEGRLVASQDRLEARLTERISQLRTDMVRWVVGAVAFNVFAIAGLMITLARIFAR